jgi:hypothetical protein
MKHGEPERPPVNPIARRPRREHPVRRPHELDLRARQHAETDIFSVRGDLPDKQLSPYAQPDPNDATTRLQRDAPRPQRRVDARAVEVARRRTIALRGRRVEHVTDAHVRRATQQRAHHRQGVHRDPHPRSDRAGRWRRRRRLAWRKRAPEGRRGPHGQRREGRRDAPRARRRAGECDGPHDVNGFWQSPSSSIPAMRVGVVSCGRECANTRTNARHREGIRHPTPGADQAPGDTSNHTKFGAAGVDAKSVTRNRLGSQPRRIGLTSGHGPTLPLSRWPPRRPDHRGDRHPAGVLPTLVYKLVARTREALHPRRRAGSCGG